MVTLYGTHFALRPLRMSDLESLLVHINDRAVARNTLTIPYPCRRREERTWLRGAVHKKKGQVLWAIDVDGRAVGTIGLHHLESRHKAELGYWLGRDYWGQGIVTEAVELVTHYAFSTLHLRRVYAYVFPFNGGSQRVLEKAGYVREGLLRKNVNKKGKILDEIVYAKIRSR